MALGLQVIAPIHLQVSGATLSLPFSGTVTVSTPVSGTGYGTFLIDERDWASAVAAGCWMHTDSALQPATGGNPNTPIAPAIMPAGQIAPVIGTPTVVGVIKAANMNTTVDQQFGWVAGGSFIVTGAIATNASTSLVTAAGGIYNTTSKSGVICAAATVYSGLTTATSAISIATAATNVWTYNATTMPYFSLTTANGNTATADIFLLGFSIS